MKKIYLAGYCHLSPALFALAKAARCNMRKVPYLESPHFLSWAPIDLPNPMFHCPEFFGKLQFE